jgi:hypothetical protein
VLSDFTVLQLLILWEGNKLIMKVMKTYRKDCALCWDVYIICICNVLILSDYCHWEVKLLSALFYLE